MHISTFDVTSEVDFSALARRFAAALKVLEPELRKGVEYKGQTLYHPLQISLLGPAASGKSSFIRKVAECYFENSIQNVIAQNYPVKSASGLRDVMAWMRWELADGSFEIRTQDDLAVSSLYPQNPEILLPTVERPHIAFREHPSAEFMKYSPLTLELSYEGSRRTLSISMDEELAAKMNFSAGTLSPGLSTPFDPSPF